MPAQHPYAASCVRGEAPSQAIPASVEITSFGLGEDLDRVQRLAEMGVARVAPMFPPAKAGYGPTYPRPVDENHAADQGLDLTEVDLRRRVIVPRPRPGTTARGRPGAPKRTPLPDLHCAATHEVRRPAAGRALADLSRPEASFPKCLTEKELSDSSMM